MAENSRHAVAAALGAVVRDHGWLLAAHPSRLRGMLNDVLGADAEDCRALVDAVVVAAEEGIAARVREAGPEGLSAVRSELVGRLEEWGMSSERAGWVVQAWGGLLPSLTARPPATAGLEETAPQPVMTELPEWGTPQEPVEGGGPGRSRWVWVAVGVAAVVAVAAGVAGVIAGVGDDGHEGAGRGSSESEPPPAEETALVATDTVSPLLEPAGGTSAMGSKNGGVQLTYLSPVSSFGEGREARSAPAGGQLIGFTLADWECEVECVSYKTLGLHVRVGSSLRPLPAAPVDTYVVAVPGGIPDEGPGTDVELVMVADGYTQTLSLTTGAPGSDNIDLLARDWNEWGYVDLSQRFQLVMSTSVRLTWEDGVVRDSTRLRVKVDGASLSFFDEGRRPSSPDRAFLRLDASFSYAFEKKEQNHIWWSEQERFVDDQGRAYRPTDVDKRPYILDLVYEVPGNLTGGAFHIGGVRNLTSTTGVPYRERISHKAIKVDFSGGSAIP